MQSHFSVENSKAEEVKKLVRTYPSMRFESNPWSIGGRTYFNISGDVHEFNDFNMKLYEKERAFQQGVKQACAICGVDDWVADGLSLSEQYCRRCGANRSVGQTLMKKVYRICTACEINHFENCEACYGFGVYKISTNPSEAFPVTAAEAHDKQFKGVVLPCPECGSTEKGCQQCIKIQKILKK